MKGWHYFFVATAGAAAVLTGLVLVGVCIRLTKILCIPHLPNRVFVSLLFLLTILIVSCLMLVPGQPCGVVGITTAAICIAVWCGEVTLHIKNIHLAKSIEYRRAYQSNSFSNPLVILP